MKTHVGFADALVRRSQGRPLMGYFAPLERLPNIDGLLGFFYRLVNPTPQTWYGQPIHPINLNSFDVSSVLSEMSIGIRSYMIDHPTPTPGERDDFRIGTDPPLMGEQVGPNEYNYQVEVFYGGMIGGWGEVLNHLGNNAFDRDARILAMLRAAYAELASPPPEGVRIRTHGSCEYLSRERSVLN